MRAGGHLRCRRLVAEADARQDARDRRPLRRRVPAVPCGSYARGERQQSAETQE